MNIIKTSIVLIFLFAVSFGFAKEKVYAPLFKCTKKMEDPYGIVAHLSRSGSSFEFDTREIGLDMIQSIGISFIRTDFDWPSFRHSLAKDAVFFDRFDKMMHSVSKRNLNMLAILTNAENDQLSSWENHTDLLINHFMGSVHYWEIVNEADLINKRNKQYSTSDYMRLLKSGYKLIKKRDKHAKVLYSGISNIKSSFFEETLDLDAPIFFDIMNFHAYTGLGVPENFLNIYNNLSKIILKHKIRNPVWLTETGYPTMGANSVSEKVQAWYLPRIYLISFACGVDKVFWYNSKASELSDEDRECHFGILHKDYSPKPAYYAYKTLVQMCPSKSTRPILSQKNDVYQAKWKRNNGKRVVGLWTSQGEKTIRIKSKGNFAIYDINGQLAQIKGDSIVVSQSILYVIGNKDIVVTNN